MHPVKHPVLQIHLPNPQIFDCFKLGGHERRHGRIHQGCLAKWFVLEPVAEPAGGKWVAALQININGVLARSMGEVLVIIPEIKLVLWFRRNRAIHQWVGCPGGLGGRGGIECQFARYAVMAANDESRLAVGGQFFPFAFHELGGFSPTTHAVGWVDLPWQGAIDFADKVGVVEKCGGQEAIHHAAGHEWTHPWPVFMDIGNHEAKHGQHAYGNPVGQHP